ncbi:unnamed protein product, partial [Protopolystoma xenopodis]
MNNELRQNYAEMKWSTGRPSGSSLLPLSLRPGDFSGMLQVTWLRRLSAQLVWSTRTQLAGLGAGTIHAATQANTTNAEAGEGGSPDEEVPKKERPVEANQSGAQIASAPSGWDNRLRLAAMGYQVCLISDDARPAELGGDIRTGREEEEESGEEEEEADGGEESNVGELSVWRPRKPGPTGQSLS